MEHVNGWCFRGIYKGGLWEDDLHVSALNLNSKILCLSLIPAILMKIQSKVKELGS